jgi:hypothetical protein
MSEAGPVRIEVLAAEMEELRAICDRLVRDNAQLRDRLEGRTSPPGPPQGAPATSAPGPGGAISRRGVLTKALGAAAVTVVGGAALANRDALPAAASNGTSVTAGNETTAEARTSVRYDGASGFGGVVLLGNDSTYGGSSASYPAGVGGWAGAGATAGKGGVTNGVYGFTDNGAGNGVIGYNSGLVAGSGAGVLGLAFGAKNIGVQGRNTLGTAISGTTDSAGANVAAVLGLISGTSPGGFSSALRGQNNGTSGLGIGVWGSHAGAGWGMYATSVSGIGLNVSGGTGTGINTAGATGLVANGGAVGVSSSGATAITATGSAVGIAASGPSAVNATGGNIAVNASGPTAVQASGTTVGVSARGPTAVTASGGTIGVNASGPTAVTANGTTVGVSASGPTALSAAGATVGVSASGPTALSAAGATTGVVASGPTAVAANGTSVGVSAGGPTGISVTGTGPVGRALVAQATSKAPTVHVANSGTGPAIRAVTGPGSGASGTGCVVGDSKNETGVLGLSENGNGVQGHSRAGRGGTFSGASAQVHLTPGPLASHPVPGETGDLYCDRAGRLWFCKRGGPQAVWKQIA